MTAWQRVRHIAPPEIFSRKDPILFICEQSVRSVHYMAYPGKEIMEIVG